MIGIISYGKVVPPAGAPANNAPEMVSGWGFNPMTEDLF